MSEYIYFRLDISPEEFQRYYRGTAAQVLVQAHDGRRVQIPAASLRPFVSYDGVRGYFRLTIDDDHRLVDLTRLSEPPA